MPQFQALQPKGQVCRLQFQSLGLSTGATPQLNHSTPPLVLPAMPTSHHVDRNMARHISGSLVAGLPNSSHISSLSSSSRHASHGCRPHGSRGPQNLNRSIQRATPSARHRHDIRQPTPRSSSTALRTRRTRQMADVEVTRCDLGDLAAEGFRKENLEAVLAKSGYKLCGKSLAHSLEIPGTACWPGGMESKSSGW